MLILASDRYERPPGGGNFEISYTFVSGTVVRGMVTIEEDRDFYVVFVDDTEAKLMGLKPGYNIMVQGVHYNENTSISIEC